MNGLVDLTAQLNALVNARAQGTNRYGIDTLTFPDFVAGVLLSDTTTFELEFKGPASGLIGGPGR